MIKTIFVRVGSQEAQGQTRANTPRGYRQAAQKLTKASIGHGLQHVRLWITDKKGNDLYFELVWLYC